MSLNSQVKVADSDDVWGKHRVSVWDFTGGSTDYVAGGYPLTAAQFGLYQITGIKAVGGNPAAAAYLVHYDTVNQKLMFEYPTGGGFNSPASLPDPVLGSGTVTASAVNSTDPALVPGRGKEVAAATDLSSLTVRLLVFGD